MSVHLHLIVVACIVGHVLSFSSGFLKSSARSVTCSRALNFGKTLTQAGSGDFIILRAADESEDGDDWEPTPGTIKLPIVQIVREHEIIAEFGMYISVC